jgi:hypothetical protein
MSLGSDGPIGRPRNFSGSDDAPTGHAPTAHDLADEALLHDAGIPAPGVPKWVWVGTAVVVLLLVLWLI